MKVTGFHRGLKELLDCGVDVAVMITDRSPSICKILTEQYPQIQHEFDAWHVVKGNLLYKGHQLHYLIHSVEVNIVLLKAKILYNRSPCSSSYLNILVFDR